MSTVSVLMPCYNAERTLPETIRSLQEQTLTDFSVVALDDGSADGTQRLLESWARTDGRVTVIHQIHAGIVAALQRGLAACRTPYVARMDADDIADPERLARQKEFLDRHPEVAVVSCQVAGFPDSQVRKGFRIYLSWLNNLTTDAEIRKEIFVESPLPHPSVMFRKDWVLRVGGYQDHGWPEDYDLWLRLYLAGAHFSKIPEVLLAWNERPDRLTRTDGRYSLENFLRAKAFYLARGPLGGRDAVLIWGAGMTGRRLSKHLLREQVPLTAFFDIDPRKIGRRRYGLPILAAEDLPAEWQKHRNPVLLAAVGARGARRLIRNRLQEWGFQEGRDWWSVA